MTRGRRGRTAVRLLLALVLAGVAVVAYAYRTALADPVVRDLTIRSDRMTGAPVTLVLISDVHVAGPDMPPERLARIVTQINALAPDIVLLAGDFVGDKPGGGRTYTAAEIAAPLGGLRSRLGSFAVLGNHDHWRDGAALSAAIRANGITLLDNEAVRVGPLAIGGIDDAFTGHADLPGTASALRALGGYPILLSHSPDPFAGSTGPIALMAAGHTHCGQIRLPLIGALTYASAHGDRFGCGVVRDGSRTLVVGAGLGTSVLPLRLGAVPDLWRIRIIPARRPSSLAVNGATR